MGRAPRPRRLPKRWTRGQTVAARRRVDSAILTSWADIDRFLGELAADFARLDAGNLKIVHEETGKRDGNVPSAAW